MDIIELQTVLKDMLKGQTIISLANRAQLGPTQVYRILNGNDFKMSTFLNFISKVNITLPMLCEHYQNMHL